MSKLNFYNGEIAHLNTPEDLINALPLLTKVICLYLKGDFIDVVFVDDEKLIKHKFKDYKNKLKYLLPWYHESKVSNNWIEIKYDAVKLYAILPYSCKSYFSSLTTTQLNELNDYEVAKKPYVTSGNIILNLYTVCKQCKEMTSNVEKALVDLTTLTEEDINNAQSKLENQC